MMFEKSLSGTHDISSSESDTETRNSPLKHDKCSHPSEKIKPQKFTFNDISDSSESEICDRNSQYHLTNESRKKQKYSSHDMSDNSDSDENNCVLRQQSQHSNVSDVCVDSVSHTINRSGCDTNCQGEASVIPSNKGDKRKRRTPEEIEASRKKAMVIFILFFFLGGGTDFLFVLFLEVK